MSISLTYGLAFLYCCKEARHNIRPTQGGLGSNPGEDMDACKCIVPLRHGGTYNNRRAASSLVRLVEGEERREAPHQPQGVLPQNWGEIELNRSVICMVLKATPNRRPIALCRDEFRGPCC
ncbi:uncharacterized protein TNCV_182251 [Trichonephila clavipes]|nr:uncharacterized protein TNCV_182251 [Trichonephila clavipes]